VVGITYGARPDDSETNLHPIKDGARIYLTLFRLAKTNNPLFYFGSVGVMSLLAGLAVAAYVAYEWFVRTPPVSHEALAVVAASGILLGVQLLMFGVLSDVIVAVNREQTRRIEELARRLGRGEQRDDRYRTDWNGSETDRTATEHEHEERPAAEAEAEPESGSPTADR
jgi:dolichol-phosphate mannosyltransferase